MKYFTPEFFRWMAGTARSSAQGIVPLAVRMVNPKSVVDLGCATGEWLAVFKEHGVRDVVGIDGDWVDRSQLKIAEHEFRSLDLSKPVQLGRTFDLVMTVESVHHIPQEGADRIVELMTTLAPVVMFSSPIPHQGGSGKYVNEQWPEYWAGLFEKRGFIPVDGLRPHVWNAEGVQWWYAQNILFYVKREALRNYPELLSVHERDPRPVLSVVHPQHYLVKVSRPPEDVPLSLWLKALPRILFKAIRRIIGTES